MILYYIYAYGCLRCMWVGGSKIYKCLRLLTVGMGGWVENIKMPTDAYGCGGWRVWFDFDPKQFQFLQP